jgi:hypothetical protein
MESDSTSGLYNISDSDTDDELHIIPDSSIRNSAIKKLLERSASVDEALNPENVTKTATIDTNARWHDTGEIDVNKTKKISVINDNASIDGAHEVGSKTDTSLANDSYLDHLSVEVGVFLLFIILLSYVLQNYICSCPKSSFLL